MLAAKPVSAGIGRVGQQDDEGMDVVLAIKKDDVIQSATVVRKRNHEYKPETQAEVR